jgi:opacity protein-like surface antigen
MKKSKDFGFITIGLCLLISASKIQSQETTGRWGVGTFVDYNRATFQLKDWYASGRSQVGGVFTYVASSKVTVEVEYHRSRFDHGSLEKRTFTWTVDNKPYASPNAVSKMKLNSFLVNTLIHKGSSRIVGSGNYSPYLTVGIGFYDYKTDVRGLIYPGQKTAPLNMGLLLEPFSDTQTALGANFGIGVEAFIFENIAVDLRGRYNVLLGELRPMEAWGLKGQTFPMQFWNLRAGVKFYFKRS